MSILIFNPLIIHLCLSYPALKKTQQNNNQLPCLSCPEVSQSVSVSHASASGCCGFMNPVNKWRDGKKSHFCYQSIFCVYNCGVNGITTVHRDRRIIFLKKRNTDEQNFICFWSFSFWGIQSVFSCTASVTHEKCVKRESYSTAAALCRLDSGDILLSRCFFHSCQSFSVQEWSSTCSLSLSRLYLWKNSWPLKQTIG